LSQSQRPYHTTVVGRATSEKPSAAACILYNPPRPHLSHAAAFVSTRYPRQTYSIRRNMANFVPQKATSQRLTVASLLLSPPETQPAESFGSSIAPTFDRLSVSSFNSQSSEGASKPSSNLPNMFPGTGMLSKGDAYASPPISPYETLSQKDNMNDVNMEDGVEQGSRDPQLFGSSSAAAPMVLEPLFPQEPTDPTTMDVITRHMKSLAYKSLPSKPSVEDYTLAASFRHTVFEQVCKNPGAWRSQERGFESHYGGPTGPQRSHATTSATLVLKKLAPAPSVRARQPKPKVAIQKAPARIARQKKAKRASLGQIFPDTAALPRPTRPATNREDTDYAALLDFCPSLDTLPRGNPKSLKTEWKGNSLNLSNDPDLPLLHEAEVALAATLRLNCATYLCSKRRIFQARLDKLRIGKEFRRTDAQQACKIDVNKASKLWQSFDKVGWFRPEYFQQYL
jgi:hypothetical protein